MAWSEPVERLHRRLSGFLEARLTPDIRRFVVGFSAGPDSMALAWALAALPDPLRRPVLLVHVHHGLHPDAEAWAARAQASAAALPADFRLCRIHLDPRANIEAQARQLRYEAIAAQCRAGDVALLAHHQDDQAETLLLNLCRGAGLGGLAGMRAVSRLPVAGSRIPCWRPWLDVPRSAILALVAEAGLQPVQDDSNHDIRFRRNFLRHEILPRLEAVWPGVSARMAETAADMREADDWLRESAESVLETCRKPSGELDLSALTALEASRRRRVLRAWLAANNLPLPDRAMLERIWHEVCLARVDAEPCLAWSGAEIRRYRNSLYADRPAWRIEPGWGAPWPDIRQPLALPDGRYVFFERTEGEGLRLDHLETGPVTVGFREGGESIRLPGREHHSSLKTLLQEAGVPPWQRASIPLIHIGGRLAAVGGRWIDADFFTASGGFRLCEMVNVGPL